MFLQLSIVKDPQYMCRLYAANSTCFEFMIVMVMLCSEDSISQYSFPFSSYCILFLLFFQSCYLSLGDNRVKIDAYLWLSKQSVIFNVLASSCISPLTVVHLQKQLFLTTLRASQVYVIKTNI